MTFAMRIARRWARTLARGHRRGVSLPGIVGIVGIAALAAAVACGDPYVRTNPYDPAFPVTIDIVGPDTTFSYTEHATFSAQTSPPFPDTAVTWEVSDSIVFAPAGLATFEAIGPPLYPATRMVTVFALIGAIDTTIGRDYTAIKTQQFRHIASKVIYQTQRVTRIQLRCPDTHACATLPAGGVWSVWVDGFDALNERIYSLTSATANPTTGAVIATFAVRDTTIASVSPVGIRAANVTALKSGSTWIVATRGPLLDSLQLVVH